MRKGFFERPKFEEVRKRLTPDIQLAVTIQYLYGWRTREVLKLEWRQIDFEQETIRLDAGTTKNKEGRVVYMTPELKEMLIRHREWVQMLERTIRRIIPYVFCHFGGEKWAGKRIGEFRKQWNKACLKAGCPGMIPHDFRRTAARNMIRKGINEGVVMKVTGHKTRSILERYNIKSDGDLKDVRDKLTGTIGAHPPQASQLKY